MIASILKYFKYRTSLRLFQSKTRLHLLRKSLIRLLPSQKITRTQEFDAKAYSEDWKYLPSSMKMDVRPGPSRIGSRILLFRSIDRRKYTLGEVKSLLASLRPASLAEFGSGNGINVLALAVLCPWIKKWRGLEITDTGIQTAKSFLKKPPYEILSFITGEGKETIDQRLEAADIDFIKGDMTNLAGVADKEFDCVFSHQAIERLPQRYMNAFSEGSRVAKYAIFVESFAEVQRSLAHWMYLVSSDYFRASLWDVEKAGFKILRFEPLYEKAKYASGILFAISRKP